MIIRFKIRRWISFENLMMILALFFISTYALLEHASISIPMISSVKFPLLYAGGICLLTQLELLLKNIVKKRYFYLLFVLLIFCGLLLVSAQANELPDIGTDPSYDTNRLVVFLAELFFLMIWVCEKGRGQYVINFLFRYVFLLVIATDFLLFTKLVSFSSGQWDTYLVGTKFTVSYLHMNLLALAFMRKGGRFSFRGKSKLLLLLAAVAGALIAIKIDCMTGVLGCVLLLLFLRKNSRKKSVRLSSPLVLLLFLAGSVIFPFVAERVIAQPFMSYLIEDVFGRDSTLTGRLNIFLLFGEKMEGHWLWGYGYGNGNLASVWLFGYANAQNALLHWVLQTGVPAAAALAGLMLMIFYQLHKSGRQQLALPLVAMVYVFIILGTIETTFSMSFILWLAVIFMLANNKEPAQ